MPAAENHAKDSLDRAASEAHNESTWLHRIDARLAQQLRFLIDIDRLKAVVRGNRLANGSRHENTAEHSWHLALFAVVLAEWSSTPAKVDRVLQMVLIHDLVAIEAGDTPLFDSQGAKDQAIHEQRAAKKLFGPAAGRPGR